MAGIQAIGLTGEGVSFVWSILTQNDCKMNDIDNGGMTMTKDTQCVTSKHKGGERGFTVCLEAWYGQSLRAGGRTDDEIMVGIYHPDGGTTGEFGIRWVMLDGEPTPRLEVFNDAWDTLQHFGDLLTWMASVDDMRVSPQMFAEALRGMGVKDLTERVMSSAR